VIKSRWYQIGYTPIGLQSPIVAQLPDFSMLGIFQQIQGRKQRRRSIGPSLLPRNPQLVGSVLQGARAVHRLLESAIKFGAQALANQRTSLFFRCRRRIGAFAFAVLKFRSGVLSLVVRYDEKLAAILSGIGTMIPGSLFSDEFTLGLIAQIRIWSAGKGFSNPFKSPSSTSPSHLA
jgi:hypothetical protein